MLFWLIWLGFQSYVRTKSTGDIPEETEKLTEADSGFSSPADGAKDTSNTNAAVTGDATTKPASAEATTPKEKK